MEWIDTHTHLFSDLFKDDVQNVVLSCHDKGIKKLLLPNIDEGTVKDMEVLVKQFPGLCLPMMGLHPTSVGKEYRSQLRTLYSLLKNKPDHYVAVGEIGTDLYWDKTFKAEMEIAFREQIRWALEFDKPVVIHSRDTLDWNISIVREFKEKDPGLRGVFHCFNGTVMQAKAIMDMGFYMGIGGVITFKNAGMDAVLDEIPLDNLVLETDSPYLAPVPYRGQRNSSEYLPLIAQKLADIKNMDLKEIARITTENARTLFRL